MSLRNNSELLEAWSTVKASDRFSLMAENSAFRAREFRMSEVVIPNGTHAKSCSSG